MSKSLIKERERDNNFDMVICIKNEVEDTSRATLESEGVKERCARSHAKAGMRENAYSRGIVFK